MSQEAMNAKFMEVYARQADPVYRFCCSFMESAIGAESVVQETFLEMAAAKVRFEHEKDERLWLLKRAARLCRDTLREGLAEYGEDAAQSPFCAELLALRELTAEQKLAVYLYYVEGYQMAELSRVLGCPTFVIRSRLEAAEGKMKDMFPEAEAMMRRREADTNTSADIHEQDMQYLATCRRTGKAAAEYYGWTVIQCVKDGTMRSIDDIHEEIYRHVTACMEE